MPEITLQSLERKPKILHTIFGTLTIGYLLLLFLLYRIDTAIIIPVIIFDILFVSLIFPLRGPLFTKTLLLLTGNLIGFAWNWMLFSLTTNTTGLLENALNSTVFILSPLLNCIWIVSLWSLGLSTISRENFEKMEPRGT